MEQNNFLPKMRSLNDLALAGVLGWEGGLEGVPQEQGGALRLLGGGGHLIPRPKQHI